MAEKRRPLMGTDNILDLQNNGYKSTVSAVAEIVDNSIQAEASKIDVVLVNNTTKSVDNIEELLIIDNGQGMNRDSFGKALMMNAGTRSGAKKGLGKYGQGLPNSSISQTTRVEVYTKQKSKLLFNYIDLIEIFESRDPFLPEIESVEFIDIPLIKENGLKFSHKTGTIVRWVKPNRIKPSTTRLLIENLTKVLGRIFRYYIHGFEEDNKIKNVDINLVVFDYNGEQYSLNNTYTEKKIKPFDPMFLMENTWMNEYFPEWQNPTSQLFDTAKKSFKVEIINAQNKVEKVQTDIEISFSHVKKEERYRNGNGKGIANRKFSEIYKRRNIIGTRGYQNISILRENREIDIGDFGFLGGGIDREILRWWSIEIKTDPIIDNIIGVDNKKQQASNIYFIDAESESDAHEILKWITTTISSNIKGLEKVIEDQYDQYIQSQDSQKKDNKKTEEGKEPLGPTEPDNHPEDDDGSNSKIEDKDKKELFDWIKDRFPDLTDTEITNRVEWAFSISDKFIFVNSSIGDTVLYDYKVYGSKVLIEINKNHSFYKRFIKDLEAEESDRKIRSIRLFICSLVKSELNNSTQNVEIQRYLRDYKNSFATALNDYIYDLFINT